MNARTLLACALVLVAAPLSAQSDPITGRWGRDGTAVLDLKLDNTGAVTGQVMNGSPDNMVPIRSGSFDRQTGVLKLAGEAKSTDTGAATPFTILGNLVGDSLKVNAAFGNFRGSLALIRLTASPRTPGAIEEHSSHIKGLIN